MTNETAVESEAFVGRWHGLISTTNWEKGRIIFEWRQSLIETSASASEYRDEAWSEMVGAVTPQHVGRLRRVYERFSPDYDSYPGLYWSHFHAAIEWEDAEMWLEGAVQNGWSVSQMRRQRWETLGGIPDFEPHDEIISCEVDEDVDQVGEFAASPAESSTTDHVPSSTEFVENLGKREDSAEDDDALVESMDDEEIDGAPLTSAAAPIRPFADLPELPEDVSEAFEAFKLAIIRHRMAEWQEISQQSLIASLEALKHFVTVA